MYFEVLARFCFISLLYVMVEVLIFSDKGYIQKDSFVSADLAHSSLLDLLRGKMGDGEIVFASIEEESVCSYAFVEDNTFFVLSAKDFFARFMPEFNRLCRAKKISMFCVNCFTQKSGHRRSTTRR
jgi:hypothetical protein